jgi:DNA-binding CsgD family transcriptional regulator
VASSDEIAPDQSDAVPGGVSSVAGYALLCGAPVVSEDLREEGRFGDAGVPPWDGPVSAVAAPISAEEGSLGVLVAYADGAGVFDDRDALSVSRIASFLGGALRHLEEQEELRRLAGEAGRRHGRRPVEGDPPEGEAPRLTARQLEVLALMAGGLSAKQIASELGLSIHTIHTHQRNLYRALGVTSFAAALRRAGELGLSMPADAGGEDRP